MKKVQINCNQHIPCNPCKYACPREAIQMDHLTDIPKPDLIKCTGCGLCITVCPGQACAVLDDSFSEVEASLSFPYEYFPTPKLGQQVQAVNNDGEEVCCATVEKIDKKDFYDGTAIITISFRRDYAGKVTGIRKIKAL